MMEVLVIALAGFVSVFALGFQSRNVNNGNYMWAAGTSVFVGMSQGLLWQHVKSPLDALVYSLAGALGIVSAMYIHKRFIQGKKEPTL